MRKLLFASCLVVALALTASWIVPNLAQTTMEWLTAKAELHKAAKAHGVTIDAEKISLVSNKSMTVMRAPIAGFAKASDADLEKGAPFELMIIKSKTKLAVPDGSYVVKVQFEPGDKRQGNLVNAAGV